MQNQLHLVIVYIVYMFVISELFYATESYSLGFNIHTADLVNLIQGTQST